MAGSLTWWGETRQSSIDANGNLVNDGVKTYGWDAANRLISVNILNAQPTTVADTIKMTYDGFGRRVGITEQHGVSVISAKTFVWCGAQLCQERDSTGATVTKQFFGLGEKIMSGPNAGNYYFTKDHLGSVREMVDANGVVQARYDYDPYGRQIKSPGGTLDADFGYTGFYMERAANLNLTWFRAYDADKGRWLNRDPLGEFEGINLYAYVRNNTLEGIDVFGLCGGNNNGAPTPTTGNPDSGSSPTIASTFQWLGMVLGAGIGSQVGAFVGEQVGAIGGYVLSPILGPEFIPFAALVGETVGSWNGFYYGGQAGRYLGECFGEFIQDAVNNVKNALK